MGHRQNVDATSICQASACEYENSYCMHIDTHMHMLILTYALPAMTNGGPFLSYLDLYSSLYGLCLQCCDSELAFGDT